MFKLSFGPAIRMGAIAMLLLPGWQLLDAQWYPQAGNYQRQSNSSAERTMEDLRQVAQRNAFTHGERERFDHALEHLSQFSRKLYAGRMDRGKLDRSIDDVGNILRHNRIDPRGREILSNDLNELMRYRANNAGYRY
jgi:exoribonuclease R